VALPDSGAADRQRKLSELCRGVLARFIDQEPTPLLVAEAEGVIRAAVDDAVRAGTYVLPDGMVVDRVELGADMRLKVYFERARVVARTSSTSDR
jgi:hypothetical protein